MSAPAPRSLVDLLRRRALEEPGRRAYTFLRDGERDEVSIGYGELDRRARAIAAALLERVAPGDRALLLYPPGLEFLAAFFACQYAGVVAVPMYPPQPRRPLDRARAVALDSEARLAMTVRPLLGFFRGRFAEDDDLSRIDWLTTDDAPLERAESWRDPELGPDALAFLQYTSGSTGEPKGVMISQGNVLHNQRVIHACFGDGPQSAGVSWLPFYHDMGLIGDAIQPLYVGAPMTFLSPLAFLQRPVRWLRAITRAGATTSGGPNFAYDMCVRRIRPAQREGLDLSSWTLAYNGSEMVSPETLDRFCEAFGPCGFRREAFYPCYGMAEATLIVAGGERGRAPRERALDAAALEAHRAAPAAPPAAATRLVSCGRPKRGVRVEIVDPVTHKRCGPGSVGEVWIAGPSVARGYWRQPARSEEIFGAHLADTEEGRFLRSDDLGFVDEEGELFLTGRLSDLLVVRGRNHYPHDIERTIEGSHPAFRPGCGAAFLDVREGDELLVVAFEIDRGALDLSGEALLQRVRRRVAAGHELHVHDLVLLEPRSIPKTSSGKVRRRACRAGLREGSLRVVWRDGA